MIAELGEHGLPLRRERALDFGCGVGRLTLGIAEHFAQVDGVDIAPSMVAQARARNPYGTRVSYHLNDVGSLAAFEDATFDLVLSMLVLQHVEPRYSLRYIAEFLRIARPGGAVVFQVPSGLRPVAPLPVQGFAAAIEAPLGDVGRLRTGERAAVCVTIRNVSRTGWPAGQGIKLANHWRVHGGEIAINDDGRTPLPRDVLPGAAEQLELVVSAPTTPGAYVLELDLVQEGVAWFADHGSTTLLLDVMVAPGPTTGEVAPSGVAKGEEAGSVGIEMHALREEFVRDLIAYSGGTLVGVREDGLAGSEWVSLTYVATV